MLQGNLNRVCAPIIKCYGAKLRHAIKVEGNLKGQKKATYHSQLRRRF